VSECDGATHPRVGLRSVRRRRRRRYRLLTTRGLRLGLHSMLAPTDQTFYQRYGDGLSSVPAFARALRSVDSETRPAKEAEAGNYYWHKDMAALAAAAAAAAAAAPVKRRGRPRKYPAAAAAAGTAAAVAAAAAVVAAGTSAAVGLGNAAPRPALAPVAASMAA
jgi:hypothetical protein